MSDKKEYEKMLDLPTDNSITVIPSKKKKIKKSAINIKEQVIEKVNSEKDLTEESEVKSKNISNEIICDTGDVVIKKSVEKKNKFNVLALEFSIIGILIATIFLTSAFVPNSGLAVFFKGVFGNEVIETNVDVNKSYTDFTPVLPVLSTENISFSDGIMTISGKSSVYSPCNGQITRLEKDENGKFEMEITHGNVFKTVFNGLDYAYFELGDNVFTSIPVGYVSNTFATACFKGSDDSLITNYSLNGETFIWEV